MKLKLMQSGGFIPPYTIYLPVLTTSGTSRRTRTDVDDFLSSTSSSRGSKSESSDTKGLITDKDLLSLVDKLDVLPSDKKEIISSLYHFYQLGSIPGMIDSSSLALKYLKTVDDISQATYNKKEFDKMMDTAISKDVLNDAALTINNHVLVFDKETGELTPMSIENYREHIDEYSRPMTNGEILLRRALFDSDDPSYLNTIQNATSLELVNKTIYDMITGFGYSQLANSTYEQRKNSLIIQGIEELLQAAENGDLTITNSTYAISDSERKKYNRPLIDRALDYILHALPPNQKALLLLYSEDGTKESMEALITHLVTSKEIYDVSTTTKDSQGDGKSVKTGNSGSHSNLNPDGKSTDRIDNDPVIGFVLGNGYQEPIAFNIGNSVPYYVIGRHSSLVEGKDGKILPANSPYSALLSSSFLPILDFSSATFGGLLVTDGSKIIIDNADVIRVDLPIDLRAAANGIFKPDFALSEKVELAEKMISDGNITDPVEINKICKSVGLPEQFTLENGKWTLNQLKYRSFALIKCKADDLAIENEDALNPGLIKELHGAEDNNLRELLKKNDASYSNSSSWYEFFSSGNQYEGYLFIPIRDSVIAASYGSGNYYKLQGNDAIKVLEAEQLTLQYIKPPSLADIKNEQ